MSKTALHTLVGTAVIDRVFCENLLNGKRHTLLVEFDLTQEERKAVEAIEAVSIQEFAARLEEWLQGNVHSVTSTRIQAPGSDTVPDWCRNTRGPDARQRYRAS